MSPPTDRESLGRWLAEVLASEDFRRATFSGAVRGPVPSPWLRVVVRPVEIRARRVVQFSYFDARKDVTRNYEPETLAEPWADLWAIGFAAIHLGTGREEIDIRITKKGKIQIGRREAEPTPTQHLGHNRVKDVPLPEGRADHLLETLGISTPDGRVKPTMRAKFTQINEFLKQVRLVLETNDWARSLGREIRLLDCGCGLSYLTLAAHHYLVHVMNLPARILGVDVNDEVIRKSLARSEQLGAERIEFAVGRIGQLDVQPDLVIALHACDTATDDAIAQAINSGAHAILSVPCCHHHLHQQVQIAGPSEVLRPILRHGILRQRTLDQVTDSFRALILRLAGYQTDIIEFVSVEHTARNLMMRAIRGAPPGEANFVREYLALISFWNVTPHLESLLGERFQALIHESA